MTGHVTLAPGAEGGRTAIRSPRLVFTFAPADEPGAEGGGYSFTAPQCGHLPFRCSRLPQFPQQ